MNFKGQKNRGMTMVELFVYVSVFSVVVVAVSAFAVYLYKSKSFVSEQTEAINESRKALKVLVNAIREADYGDDGAYPVENMSSSALTIYSDIDNDEKIEKLHFYLDGTNLKMDIYESSGLPPNYSFSKRKTLAYNVRNLSLGKNLFEFYDGAGNKITDFNKVLDLRRVVIRIFSDVNPYRAPQVYEFRSNASLRNLINAYENK